MKILCNSCDGIYDSLDVRFTKSCDNNCSFCIEQNGLSDQGEASPEDLISSTIESGIKSVLILGGEPFINSERLYSYVKGIRTHVEEIYITTSVPKSFILKEELVYKIIELVDGLNISLQDSNWEINNRILRASSNHNRTLVLSKLNTVYSDKIRVSVNLAKGGLDNKYKVGRVLGTLQSIGCKHVKINELQSSDLYVSFEDMFDIKLKSPYSSGCQAEIDMSSYGIKNMKVTLKRSCFLVEKSRKASIMDLVKSVTKIFVKRENKFAVMYENGKLERGWIQC